MFERFLAAYPVDGSPLGVGRDLLMQEWMEIAGGRSFAAGLYRVHSLVSARTSEALIRAAYPEFTGQYVCFAYDWLGRQFACRTTTDTDPSILMFEPGTGDALEIPVSFSQFHDTELVDYGEAALASTFYSAWLDSGGVRPNASQCIGYRVPLFLGGADAVPNLELSDLDVYWTLMGQLRIAKLLQGGTSVRTVTGEG